METLWIRLKERKLVQWALAYLAGAWLLLQVFGELRDNFGWAPVAGQMLTVLLAVGFLAVLVLAWYHGEKGHQRVTGMEVLMLSGILVLAGAAVAFVGGRENAAAGLDGTSHWRFLAADDADRRSIAVLPFADLSERGDQEYFSDGITEEILSALSKIGQLRVISRTSVMQYKGTAKNLRQIGAELGVATVLEGSVRRAGERVRITAQLIDARTDQQLWSETYDRQLTDIFEIQSEIARQIAGALQATLSPEENQRIAAGRTENLTAYDLYLRAREHSFRWADLETGPRNIESAIALARQALELDPGYARGYGVLSVSFGFRALMQGEVWADSALAAARRMIALEPTLGDGYAVLTNAYMVSGQFDSATVSARRALALDPNNALATALLCLGLYLQNHYDEAVPRCIEATRRDPLLGWNYERTARVYRALGLYAQAEEWHRRRLRIEPDDGVSRALLADMYLEQGDTARAAAEMRAALAVAPNNGEVREAAADLEIVRGDYAAARALLEPVVHGRAFRLRSGVTLGFVYQKLGEPERARELLRAQERDAREGIARGAAPHMNAYALASIRAVEGSRDEAIRWLEQAYDHGYRPFRALRLERTFESLHADPRFERVTARMESDVARMRQRIGREGL